MATSSSSTKKAAKLAQKGKGQKVRFQGGTLFPIVVALVIVLGFGLVVYSRESRTDASAPTVDDHWHHSYGFLLCDEWFELVGDAEERDTNNQLLNDEFRRSGIHSHEDGLIHWHAFGRAAVGSNARLGVFLDVYGVELTNTKLQFPEEQRPFLPYEQDTGLFEEEETTCVIDGEERDGFLQVVVWDNFSDTDDGTTFIADFDNIRLDQDGMAISIAFVPDGAEVGKPPSAPNTDQATDILQNQPDIIPEDLFSGVTTTVPEGLTEAPESDN